MTSNVLSLNPSKTKFLLIGFPQQLAQVNQPVLHLPDNTTVTPVTNARNLGIDSILLCHSNNTYTFSQRHVSTTVVTLEALDLYLILALPVLLQQLLSTPSYTPITIAYYHHK